MFCAGANASEAAPETMSPTSSMGFSAAPTASKMFWRFARNAAKPSFWRASSCLRSSTDFMGGVVKSVRASPDLSL